MSQALWSKTTLAQAIGLTVAGATVTATDVLAQDGTHLRVTLLNQNFEFDDLSSTKYASGSGEADASTNIQADLTVPVAPNWDVRLGMKNTDADGNDAGLSYSPAKYASYSITSRLSSLDSQVIDFEAGHHLKLGQQDVRVFAGLRYIDLDSEASTTMSFQYAKYSMAYSVTRKSELEAYGLRAGAETSIPLAKGLSVNGLMAVSAVKGERENTAIISFNTAKYGYSSALPVEDDDDTWLGTELEASLVWDPSPENDSGPLLSLGYAWSKTNDILSTSVANMNSDESDLTETALFARIDFKL